LFLSIALVTFVILSAAILITPQRYTVTSSIELASAIQDGRLKPIEPPAEVAKQITDVYLASASSALAGKGASPAALAAVQNLRVEAVGRSVVMRGRANPKFANIYKEIQQTIVDQMIKDEAPLLQTIRGLLDIKLNSARNTSDELQKQITAITTELADTATSSNYLNQRSKQRQAELATIRQHDTSESGDHKSVEPEIRELHDWMGRSASASASAIVAITRANYFNSLATLRHQDQEQRKIIADTAQEQKMLSDARVLHAPIVAPIPDGSRKLYMFAAAFVASILFAFGATILLCRLRSQQA
jgi:hypothetical protein